jgi:hypothetical protein
LHRVLGLREEVGYGERAREVAAALALHFERGQDTNRTVLYLQLAGENALRRSAYQEALAHFQRGAEFLRTLPATPDRARRELELQRQLEAQSDEADKRFKLELQQKELAFQAKLKQREQELTTRADVRETELQNQRVSELRAREEDWERQAESRVRATETRLSHEAQQKEEQSLSKARQRDQQWQLKLDGLQAELEAKTEGVLTAAREQWEKEAEKRTATAIEPCKSMLTRMEKEREEAEQSASDRAARCKPGEKINGSVLVPQHLEKWKKTGRNLI